MTSDDRRAAIYHRKFNNKSSYIFFLYHFKMLCIRRDEQPKRTLDGHIK